MAGLNIGSPSWRVRSLSLPSRLFLLSTLVILCLVLNTVGAGAQTTDDHGNTFGTATTLTLGSSITGRIDPGSDVDVFKLDLTGRSGSTDVWIYSTGELDTVGGLYDVDPRRPFLVNDNSSIVGRPFNFHLRATLAPAVYYVGVFSFDRFTIGDYVLHSEAVIDPGNTISTAKILDLGTPAAGSIGFVGDADYFRLDLSATTNVYLYGLSVQSEPLWGFPVDSGNSFLNANIHLFRLGFRIRDTFGPGTHFIRVITYSDVTSHPIPYTIHALEDVAYTNFFEQCRTATNSLSNFQTEDPLYGCQWHLHNTTGEDVRVESVWAEGIRGDGINIAIVDDGLDFNHVDLRENVNSSLNHNYTDIGSVYRFNEHHGTQVAGLIAARDNAIGVRGVAPRATIYGYNHLVDPSIFSESDAMTRNAAVTAVSNNSWGHVEGPGLSLASAFWERAVESGANSGYGGKGVFYSWATGNGHPEDNSNLDELTNHYAVTAVCAVNDGDLRASYSEMGANLWVCAPSGERTLLEHREIVTTENSDRYVYDFSGTSASTPIVSGVAALMRQANPDLTWRDLKLILAASARKNDPTNAGWMDGAPMYGSTSTSDRYSFNHEYGFGVVDAKAAVDLARGWTNAPPQKNVSASSGNLNVVVPDATTEGPLTSVTHSLSLNSDINFTEFVEVNVTFDHPSFRDLDIRLVSPSGAESILTVPFDTFTPDDPTDDDFIALRGSFRLGSARHLGEDPNGVWQLRVTDRVTEVSGVFQSWSIQVYGHSGTPVSTSTCVTGGAVANASSNPGLVSDCETLLEARDTLVGTGTSLNWSANTPMSDWDGVTVEGTPLRVTGVSLRNKGLRGTLPEGLSNLTSLTVLDLMTPTCDGGPCPDVQDHERNLLTGPIPASLGNIGGLQQLLLHNNDLTGEIPPALGRLSNLQELALGLNQLHGTIPSQLGYLSSLTELHLWSNQLTGSVPESLGNLTSLKWLSLSQNQLTGTVPMQLGNLSVLEHLWLSQNQLSGPIPGELNRLTELRTLFVFSNQLDGQIPSWLGSLSNMEELWLSQNQLTGQIPESLGNLTNLKELSLWSNRLSGAVPHSLTRLVSLETLYLSLNQFDGCIPAVLQGVSTNDLADLALPFCVQPSVTLSKTSPDAPIRLNSLIQVTATFSEPVSGFEVGDVSVAHGITSNFVGSDGDSVYTFDVTPNAIGVVTVDVSQDAAVDSEGNGNTAAVQLRLGMPYDDDNDGNISSTEVLRGVSDYFRGILNAQQVLQLVALYFSSPG